LAFHICIACTLPELPRRLIVKHRQFCDPGLEPTTPRTSSPRRVRKKSGSDDGAKFHGQKRSNDTHESTTDPDARLYKKSYGEESHLAYLGHALVENRNGLIAAAMAMLCRTN